MLLPRVKGVAFQWLLAPDRVVSHLCHCLVYVSFLSLHKCQLSKQAQIKIPIALKFTWGSLVSTD